MFSKRKLLHSSGIGVAVLLLAGTGLAQQKTTTVIREKPAVDNSARVEQLYNEGVAAANRKQWDKAEQKFEEAFGMDPNPQIAANLGNAELAGGKPCDAVEHFEYFLNKAKDVGPDGRAEIKSLFDQAVSRVVLVKLVVNQDGADVLVDGQSVGKSRQDHRICLKSGPHTFVVTKDGWEPASHFEILPQGLSTEVKLEMKVAKGAKVFPSGTNTESSTAGKDWRLPWIAGSGGVAAVGLGFGIGLTLLGNRLSKESFAEASKLQDGTPTVYSNPCLDPENRRQCNEITSKSERADQFGAIGLGGFVIGGASIVAMGVMVAQLKTNPRLRVAPIVGLGRRGLVLEGSFF